MRDPSRWQPLSLGEQLSQNGLPIPGNIQAFIGPHWGDVTGFALPAVDAATSRSTRDRHLAWAIQRPPTRSGWRRWTSCMPRASSIRPTASTIDIGPGALGANLLGTNDGVGHAIDPATGRPYAPNVVLRADFARALAEYWADGPKSETPPGHWNVIANQVADAPAFARRIGGEGPELDPLEWDVKPTSPSTERSTTRRSRPGASRASTTRRGRSR